METIYTSLFAAIVLAVVTKGNEYHEEKDNNKASHARQTIIGVLKHVTDAQQHCRKNQEHGKNVQQRKSTPNTGGFAKQSRRTDRESPHLWYRVKYKYTGHIESYMRQGNLQWLGTAGDQCGQETCYGRTNIGSESQGIHLFQTNGTQSHEWCQHSCKNWRRLNKDSQGATNDQSQIPVYIGWFVNDSRGDSQQHRFEDRNKTNQANVENNYSHKEDNTTRNSIIVRGCFVHEKGRACIREYKKIVLAKKGSKYTLAKSLFEQYSSVHLLVLWLHLMSSTVVQVVAETISSSQKGG